MKTTHYDTQDRLQILATLIPALTALVGFALAGPAYAERDIGYREGLNEAQAAKKEAATVRVTGELLCTLAPENSGQACNLKIKELATDRVFGIADTTVAANALKRLYFNGARIVTVEGRMASADSIAVASSEAQ